MPNLDDLIKKEYPPEDQQIYFDTIPLIKVIVMSVVTCNIYLICWSYRMWSELNDKGYAINPYLRGLFFPFTNFILFPIIERYLKKITDNETQTNLLLIPVTAMLAGGIYTPILFAIFWLLLMLPVIDIQSKINKANKTYCNGGYVDGWNKTDIVFILNIAILTFLFFLFL